jgi:predicted nucleic acid-binding protein
MTHSTNVITAVNTMPVISLCAIGKLDILEKLFGEIIIPEAVYSEIKSKKSYGYEEVDTEFIKVKKIKGTFYRDLLLNQLDFGEAETIILAKELNADNVIIDESLGYRIATNSGLNVVRTIIYLVSSKRKKDCERSKTFAG